MPDRLLVQFLEKWIRDAEFRCRVLHKEQTTLETEEGLSQHQIDTLLSLDKQLDSYGDSQGVRRSRRGPGQRQEGYE